MQEKTFLREKLLQERQAMRRERVEAASAAIIQTLQKITPWETLRNVHCYEPLVALNEVNTRPFLSFLTETYDHANVYTTRKIGKRWRHVRFEGTEPETVPAFDCIIVPMLGFDEEKYRIGYGSGFYDRFLASQPAALTVGVCFEQGRVERLPREDHDVPLNTIITEVSTY